jgi:hypothetical protein
MRSFGKTKDHMRSLGKEQKTKKKKEIGGSN